MAIDVGVVFLRCTIFDRNNDLYPGEIVEEEHKNVLGSSYFRTDLSFYSSKHGGTFHFLMFNMKYFETFSKSNSFKALMEFFDMKFGEEKTKESLRVIVEKLKKLHMKLESPKHKDSIDSCSSSESDFEARPEEKAYPEMSILSTGGYFNDF